jgi:hypothetical protein
MENPIRHVRFRRLAGLGVIAALLATAFAPAVAASQGPPATSPSFSTRSIEKVVATQSLDSLRMSWKAADPAKTAPKQATESGSFFKTRTGLLVIVAMAAGTGYALYSAKEDRIRGSIR